MLVILSSPITLWVMLILTFIAICCEWETEIFIGAITLFIIRNIYVDNISDINWYHILGYLLIGISWSIFMYREFIKEVTKKYNEQRRNYLTVVKVREFKNEVSYARNSSKITAWTFNWPFYWIIYITNKSLVILDTLLFEHIKKYFRDFIDKQSRNLE